MSASQDVHVAPSRVVYKFARRPGDGWMSYRRPESFKFRYATEPSGGKPLTTVPRLCYSGRAASPKICGINSLEVQARLHHMMRLGAARVTPSGANPPGKRAQIEVV